ncbi:hypothetical protein VKT23_020398 [Stygiomarasmius scandens]|uniref:Uncharacterized protein n=1 Tax=Marasmiellus scandens TaxID=2682957 RepID=A0ABR1IJ78_9AGAR
MSDEFIHALRQTAQALRILSDVYEKEQGPPSNLKVFDYATLTHVCFTEALLSASTALYSLSSAYRPELSEENEVKKEYPEDIDLEWHTEFDQPTLDSSPPARPPTPLWSSQE